MKFTKIICTCAVFFCFTLSFSVLYGCKEEEIPLEPKKELEYVLTNNDTEYQVSGIGTLEDNDIVIPSEYNGKSVTSIGGSAFKNSNLTKVIIPNTVIEIGGFAFYGCTSLSEITMGNGIKIIGEYAFYNCSTLSEIVIPQSVTEIGEYAFSSCAIIKSNDYLNGCYLGNTDNPYLFLQKAYSTDITDCTINENCKFIGAEAFKDCSKLTEMIIPNSVIGIGGYSFYNCNSLSNVTLSNSVKSIGVYAFYNCKSLEKINIPKGVTDIGEYAFCDCSKATELVLSDSVVNIGYYAFKGCKSLTRIETPKSVTEIDYYAFGDCSNLSEVIFSNGIIYIGDDAFCHCDSLTEITFNGTKDEWNKIRKSGFWSHGSVIETVHCSDGDIIEKKTKN